MGLRSAWGPNRASPEGSGRSLGTEADFAAWLGRASGAEAGSSVCLEAFLEAERCFFVDDSPANVEGALRGGLSGCVFRGSTAELRRKLRAAGVRCAE